MELANCAPREDLVNWAHRAGARWPAAHTERALLVSGCPHARGEDLAGHNARMEEIADRLRSRGGIPVHDTRWEELVGRLHARALRSPLARGQRGRSSQTGCAQRGGGGGGR